MIHLIIVLLLTLVPQQPVPPAMQLLVRGADDAGVPAVTLQLQSDDGTQIRVVTDTRGIATIPSVSGTVVWLWAADDGQGEALTLEVAPPDTAFRFVLTPEPRTILLRLDGSSVSLDPQMIFSPDEPGESVIALPPQLLVAPSSQTVGGMPSSPDGDTLAVVSPVVTGVRWAIWCMAGVVVLLLSLGLLITYRRGKQS